MSGMLPSHDSHREIAAQRHREADAWARGRSLSSIARGGADTDRAVDRVEAQARRARMALLQRGARLTAIVGPSVGILAIGWTVLLA
jgi:hypothetical protein